MNTIPFWVLAFFVCTGTICMIHFGRFELLPSVIPIAAGMALYLLSRRPAGNGGR